MALAVMKRWVLPILLAFMLAIFSPFATAQVPTTPGVHYRGVYVTVVTKSCVYSDAEVKLDGVTKGHTDGNGKLFIPNVPTGPHTLVASWGMGATDGDTYTGTATFTQKTDSDAYVTVPFSGACL